MKERMAGFRTIRYQIPVLCLVCVGGGFVDTKEGVKKCPNCTNGEVMKWVNEVRHDTEGKEDERIQQT